MLALLEGYKMPATKTKESSPGGTAEAPFKASPIHSGLRQNEISMGREEEEKNKERERERERDAFRIIATATLFLKLAAFQARLTHCKDTPK